jgi:hypothetical protein
MLITLTLLAVLALLLTVAISTLSGRRFIEFQTGCRAASTAFFPKASASTVTASFSISLYPRSYSPAL